MTESVVHLTSLVFDKYRCVTTASVFSKSLCISLSSLLATGCVGLQYCVICCMPCQHMLRQNTMIARICCDTEVTSDRPYSKCASFLNYYIFG